MAIAGCNPDHIDVQLPPPIDSGVVARVDAFVPRPDAGHDAGTDAGQDAGRDAGAAPACVVTGGACDPFERDPCGANRTCISDATMRTRCVSSAFTLRGEGESCSVDNQCAERLECRALFSELACVRQCRIDGVGDCGAAGRCLMQARTGETCLGLCVPVNDCDLFTQDCTGGRACVLLGDPESEGEIATCLPPGAAAVGQSCAWADSCVRGAACIGGTCRQLCGDSLDCTTGTCSGRTVSGVGYCR
ncbi:hypothetical protein [Sandaracinus amylolyticus]|uniref:hypothetical protein n=1 Tax=Sandaracinus amylolyticus TaxID=927083 RepID=UPI001F3A5C3D|nr:hypothetical protein [Sandaracinus amylolyticus]UJR82138.1 Hypothetical protein I5071_42030 [Sandaracinus amylolyticus]